MIHCQPLTKLPKAILFDNDGVLIESEKLHMAAWAKMLRQYKIPATVPELEALVGKTAPQILTTFLDRYKPGWTPAEFDVDGIALRKNDFYLEEMKSNLRLYPGVLEGLNSLQSRGIKMAIVTNAKRRELEASLDVLGTKKYFTALISRDDISSPKPSPIPYLEAAMSCGVSPFEAMVVEDSPPGLTAGLLAGIPTVAIATNFAPYQLQEPIENRPDLMPVKILSGMIQFFEWILTLR